MSGRALLSVPPKSELTDETKPYGKLRNAIKQKRKYHIRYSNSNFYEYYDNIDLLKDYNRLQRQDGQKYNSCVPPLKYNAKNSNILRTDSYFEIWPISDVIDFFYGYLDAFWYQVVGDDILRTVPLIPYRIPEGYPHTIK